MSRSTRVWVTRDERADGPLCAALERAGLAPVLEPVVRRQIVIDLGTEVARLAREDWLVLTSGFAIDAVPPEFARVPRVAVVGAASRERALARGMRVELMSAAGSAAGLFEKLAQRAAGRVVLYPRSSAAKTPALPASIDLRSPVLYEIVQRLWRRDVIDEIDVISVASPSAVRAIGRVDRPFASIGRTTTRALAALDVVPLVQPPEPTFEGLARAIAAALAT